MLETVSLKLNADELIKMALKEDISNEDVSTNAVLKDCKKGKADLICKQDGVICGLNVFE
ncbi:MAG: nicotinate-nucleotide diphosphorylase (carboxylating), partial [Clostridiales bacterium]|nr:nicotinate-nucleotide diphosphorylase (carboxylating) [Clostridiales bacterium]